MRQLFILINTGQKLSVILIGLDSGTFGRETRELRPICTLGREYILAGLHFKVRPYEKFSTKLIITPGF